MAEFSDWDVDDIRRMKGKLDGIQGVDVINNARSIVIGRSRVRPRYSAGGGGELPSVQYENQFIGGVAVNVTGAKFVAFHSMTSGGGSGGST